MKKNCASSWLFTKILILYLELYTVIYSYHCQSQWPRGLRCGSAAARLLKSWVRIPPGAWMFVCCERCVTLTFSWPCISVIIFVNNQLDAQSIFSCMFISVLYMFRAAIVPIIRRINPLNPELNSICYLLALLAHHFIHVSRIRVKSLTIRLLMSFIYGAPILDVCRSHTTTHHSR